MTSRTFSLNFDIDGFTHRAVYQNTSHQARRRMNQEQMMQAVAHAMSQVFGENVGFVLLTAEFGKIGGGRVNYVSNGRREDMHAMMREYLARVDGNYHEGGKA